MKILVIMFLYSFLNYVSAAIKEDKMKDKPMDLKGRVTDSLGNSKFNQDGVVLRKGYLYQTDRLGNAQFNKPRIKFK